MYKRDNIKNFLYSYNVLKFILGTVLFLIGISTNYLSLLILAYIVLGYDVVFKSFKNLFKGNLFDENFLMFIATLGGIWISQYSEAVAVMLFYQLGELFADYSILQSKRSIKSLLELRPDYANIKREDVIVKVDIEDVKVGDLLIVKSGEKIPVDGIITKGESSVNTSALTGESLPKDVKVGDELFGGYINNQGILEITALRTYKNSAIAKVMTLVEEAKNKKTPSEKFITKFSKVYTPLVVILAALVVILPIIFIENTDINVWIYRACMLLIISCPCALVVSIPTTYFSGLGVAAKNGILIKGNNYLDILTKLDTIVMDKTGTITKGNFEVIDIKTNDIAENILLELVSAGEFYSAHPIATSLKKYADYRIDEKLISNYKSLAGKGSKLKYKNKELLVGNDKLMLDNGVNYIVNDKLGTVVYIAYNKKFMGSIVVADVIKEDTFILLKELKRKNKKIVILTGDKKSIAENIAKKLSIDEVYAELLPEDKVKILEKLRTNTKNNIAFVGDGINDTPVLASADIGISMGTLGSDAALESSDMILMDDKLSKITKAIDIALKTKQIVYQNIVGIMLVKIIFLILGIFGISTMWEAIISDVGMTVLSLINSFRLLVMMRKRKTH